jgi:hypothetical protein
VSVRNKGRPNSSVHFATSAPKRNPIPIGTVWQKSGVNCGIAVCKIVRKKIIVAGELRTLALKPHG